MAWPRTAATDRTGAYLRILIASINQELCNHDATKLHRRIPWRVITTRPAMASPVRDYARVPPPALRARAVLANIVV